MAKGRLRCLGNTVHLKSKFGIGYKLTLALEATADRDKIKQVIRSFLIWGLLTYSAEILIKIWFSQTWFSQMVKTAVDEEVLDEEEVQIVKLEAFFTLLSDSWVGWLLEQISGAADVHAQDVGWR